MKGEININKGNKRVKGSWREIGGKVVYYTLVYCNLERAE